MGLKSFLVSKYGAITGAVLGVGAGVGANVAIAEGLKEGLAEEAKNNKLLEIAASYNMTDYTIPELYGIFRSEANMHNPLAIEALNQVDLAGAAAEMTSYYQPTTLMGTAAACAVVVAGYCIARHFAKKSLNSQELEK